MLEVQEPNSRDAEASFPPLQPVERPAVSPREGTVKGHWVESKLMPTFAIV